MRGVGPGDGIDTRQAAQAGAVVQQHGQATEVAPRQAVVNLARLRHHEVDVVEQPFARRADMAALAFLLRDGAMRFVQRGDVLAQPWEERRGTAGAGRAAMFGRQLLAQRPEASGAQQFGAHGRMQDTAPC